MAARYSMDRTTEKECEDIGSSIDQDTSADVIDQEKDIKGKETIKSESEEHVGIVIIGRTGSGKSSLGNQILKENLFNGGLSPISVTENTKVQKRIRNGINVSVADTPGLFHTHISKSNVKKIILRSIDMTIPGPHVFLYTIKIGRHSDEELNSFKIFLEIFGDDVFNHTILVFTWKDYLLEESINMYFEKLPENFKKICKKCNKRIVAINNFATDGESQKQWEELLTLIKTTIMENSKNYFVADMIKSSSVLEFFKSTFKLPKLSSSVHHD